MLKLKKNTAIKPKGDYIAGKFVRRRQPDGEIPSVNPGDSDVIIGDFPTYNQAPQEALEAAKQAFSAWSTLTIEARLAMLRKLQAELRNRKDDLARIISLETGRPLWETRDEVHLMHADLEGLLRRALAEMSLGNAPHGQADVSFRPLGVVTVLSPYPQPALLPHLDMISALVTGSTVVCKPSEHTPAVGQLYAEIAHEADLPKGVFNLILGGAQAGEALASNPLTDGVLFAGSASTGQALQHLEAKAPGKMLRILASGQPAALVMDDASLSEAVLQIVIGACMTAGQRCTSTRFVLAHRRIAEKLTEKLSNLIQNLRVGHGAEPDSFMGPLLSARVLNSFLEAQKTLEHLGAVGLIQGAPLSNRRRGFYVSPGLFRAHATNYSQIAELEMLGPLLIVVEISTLEEGVELIGKSPFNLAMSIFCRSERYMSILKQLQPVGLCLQNLPTTKISPELPLHPRGLSGNGMPAGILTARLCTRPLTIVPHPGGNIDLTSLPPGLPRELY